MTDFSSPIPDRCKLITGPQKTIIRMRWYNSIAWLLLLFAIFFDAPLFLGLYQWVFESDLTVHTRELAVLPFICIDFFITYLALSCIVNVTDIILAPDRIKLSIHPLPWFGKNLLTRDLVDFFIREKCNNKGSVTYEIVYVDLTSELAKEGAKIFLGGRSKEEADFIYHYLKQALPAKPHQTPTITFSGNPTPKPVHATSATSDKESMAQAVAYFSKSDFSIPSHNPPTDDKPSITPWVVFSLICLVVGIYATWPMIFGLYHVCISASWPSTTATILESRVDQTYYKNQKFLGKDTFYTPIISYSYEVSGHEYKSQGVSPDYNYNSKYADAMVNHYQVGSRYPVYYSTGNPANAYLEKGLHLSLYETDDFEITIVGTFFITLAFVLVGIGILTPLYGKRTEKGYTLESNTPLSFAILLGILLIVAQVFLLVFFPIFAFSKAVFHW